MTDIVERLRNRAIPDQDCEDAADEIERLRAERDHWYSLVPRADRVQFPFRAS